MPNAAIILYLAWALYVLAFVVNHMRVRHGRQGAEAENRVQRDRRSDAGMALQFVAAAICFVFRRSEASAAAVAAGSVVAAVSVSLTWYALGHLGRQWRLAAVVTDDHELVRTGPYRVVRHPVYTAFLGMVAATALMLSPPWATAIALLSFAVGTEIRVRAEDSLLATHFPETFPDYRRDVPAWLPPFR